jgi:hypothetical protein
MAADKKLVMRYIALNDLIAEIFADDEGGRVQQRLLTAQRKSDRMAPRLRLGHIRRNGTNKWSPVKDRLTSILGNKCWYTEAELVGAHLTIDHYRPISSYWFLAYEPENYRVACPFANSPEHNLEHGLAGGKGESFPLLPPGRRARVKNSLRIEKPTILDPCNEDDCELLAFQSDGRPVLNPQKANDLTATERVEKSKLLLNLDHPDFNTKREQLYHDIADDVQEYEDLPAGSESRENVRNRMQRRLGRTAPFSTAARYYLQLHRHLDWVDTLLKDAAA